MEGITANFTSFEDFSSRMILLPLHDDECTGAKVGSHEVPPTEIISHGNSDAPPAVDEKEEHEHPIEVGDRTMDAGDVQGMEEISQSAEEGKEEETDSCSAAQDCSAEAEKDQKDCVDGDNGNENKEMQVQVSPSTEEKCQSDENEEKKDGDVDDSNDHVCEKQNDTQKKDIPVPIGYVLVEIRDHSDNGNEIPQDIENIEFADLLGVLRKASFPLSLVFAPSNDDTPTSAQSKGSFFSESLEGGGTASRTHSKSGPLDVEEELSEDESSSAESESASLAAALVSREEAANAAKYAKQAASAFSGRLRGWGYQAATKAAETASQVKELRDERQRKLKEEQQNRDGQNENGEQYENQPETVDDGNDLSTTNESEKAAPQDRMPDPKPLDDTPQGKETIAAVELIEMDPVFMFLQTPSGFMQLSDINRVDTPSITNKSVVSVRLSEEKACPLGKNGSIFQWYRSISESVAPEPDQDNHEVSGWSLLPGACYAAYQPSVIDAGHRLRCIVKDPTNGSQLTCHLPCIVIVDQTMLDSVKSTLLGGPKSLSFGNLREMEDLSNIRLKVDVNSNDNFISSSALFIDKKTNASDDGSQDEMEPVLHFKAVSDPSKICFVHHMGI